MNNLPAYSRPLWLGLSVLWTVIALAMWWMYLPRAQNLPHDPELAGRLSYNATSILRPSAVPAKPARGALIWVDSPRVVRMSNGADLAFPFSASGEETALVMAEYRELLNDQANVMRGHFLLEMLALWLLPFIALLAGGPMLAGIVYRGQLQKWQWGTRTVRQRTEFAAAAEHNEFKDRAVASRVINDARMRPINFGCAV